MTNIPSILVQYTEVELNPSATQRSNTPWLDCAVVDAEQCMVVMEAVGNVTLAGALVVTLEVGIDGGNGLTLPGTIASVSTLTAAAPVSPPIDVSGVGSIRARVTTANGAAAKGRFKFLFRKTGGFAADLQGKLRGGEGILTGTPSTIGTGAPGSGSGAISPDA